MIRGDWGEVSRLARSSSSRPSTLRPFDPSTSSGQAESLSSGQPFDKLRESGEFKLRATLRQAQGERRVRLRARGEERFRASGEFRLRARGEERFRASGEFRLRARGEERFRGNGESRFKEKAESAGSVGTD